MFWEPKGVFVWYYGPFTPAEALRTARRVLGDERTDRLHFMLLDFRGIERCALGPRGTRELEPAIAIAIGAAHSIPDCVIAVLVPDHADHAVYREVFSAMPYRYEIFRTENDARDWIAQTR